MDCQKRKNLILIVEDDIVVAMTGKKILERYGYETIVAHTGEAAVALFDKDNSIDLILMDIDLGEGIDGTEAARIILARRDLPVIFLSSHVEHEIVEKTEKITSYGYVVKGTGITVLDASIKMAFKLFHSRLKEREKENALIESVLNYKNIYDNAIEGLYRISADDKIIQINKSLAVILGYDSTEDIINNVNEVKTQIWADLEERNRYIELLRSQGAVRNYECRFKRKDGTVVWVSINSRLNYNHLGVPEYTDGFLEDISERKRSEEKLAELQALQTAIFNGTVDFIWAVDPENFGLTVFNKALMEYFQTNRGIIIKSGDRPEELFTDENYVKLWKNMYKKAIDEGPYTIEYEVYSKTQTLELNFNALERNGSVFAVSVFGKVITERRRIEEELRKRENYRRIFENSNEGILVIDDEGKITFANERFSKLISRPLTEIINRRLEEFIFETDASAFDEYMAKVFLENRANLECRFKRDAESFLWAGVSVTILKKHDGGFDGACVIIYDINDRKLAEEKVKQLLSEKEMLLREVHHRIKNNMNIIAGLLIMQRESIIDSAARDALAVAKNRIMSMMLLYEKLYVSKNLDYTSFECYISHLIDQIVGNSADNKNITVLKFIEDFSINPEYLSYIGIVINELFTNSLKYAFVNKECGTLFLNSSVMDGEVEIVAGDDGTGLPEHIKSLKCGGFGFQLIETMIEQLNGTIKIVRGAGTKFVINFNYKSLNNQKY